jgi:hypothetical protein
MFRMKAPRKSASWQEVRRVLSAKSHEALLQLIRDLYALRPEVKDFIHARFLTTRKSLAPYKKTIHASLSPDVIHGEDLDLERGQQAINDYQNATSDPLGTLDLMVHYVECGTRFAVEYSYGDEELFESLDAMFTQIVTTVQHSAQQTIDRFLPRLTAIVHQAEGMGWGYYDALSETLAEAFPEAR